VQSRSQKTRALVVAAARKAFTEQGYAATTAKAIAEAAGIGTGTFYHYFPDKDAALAEICSERSQYLAAEAEKISAPPEEASSPSDFVDAARARLVAVVQLSLDYHREDPGLHAVIEERRGSDPVIQLIMLSSEERILRRFAGALSFWGHDGDAEAAAFMMYSLLEGAVHAHVLSRPVLSDGRFVAALVEALLRIALPSQLVGQGLLSTPPFSSSTQEPSHAGRRSG